MNIAVIGVGGTGGYFGGKLTQVLKTRKDINITFIARGRHLEEIKKNGLLLDSDDGIMTCIPTYATDKISELRSPDLCLLCVKGYDLADVLVQLKPVAGDRTMILPLLNGVDIYQRIRSVITNGVIFPSCVYVSTHIEKPGMVIQRGGARTIHFGSDPADDYVDPEIFEIFKQSEIRYIWSDNPYNEIWSKFIFIASYGLVTANYNKTIGEVFRSEELSGYVKNIMSEIRMIAAANNIQLPSSIIEDSYLKGKNFPFETKTSFQRDYEISDKPDERDLFGGTILRMGEESGIGTGTTSMIYNSLQKRKILKT